MNGLNKFFLMAFFALLGQLATVFAMEPVKKRQRLGSKKAVARKLVRKKQRAGQSSASMEPVKKRQRVDQGPAEEVKSAVEEVKSTEIKTEIKSEVKVEAQALEPRRLAMFFDYNNNERSDAGECDAFARRLAVNFQQKACSCIVSKSVLLNFLERKKNEEEFFRLIDFDLKDAWDLYYVKDTPLFMIMKKTDDLSDKVIFSQEKTFDIPIFKHKEWTKYTGENQLDAIISFVNGTPEISQFFIKHLQAIFTSDKDLKVDEQYQEMRTFLESILIDEKTIFSSVASTTFEETEGEEETKREEVGEGVGFRGEFKLLKFGGINLSRMFFRPWNIFIGGHGAIHISIAGIPANKFSQVLEFLNQLNTHFVLIVSCSSGGKNINYLKFKETMPLAFNYFLALAGISDAPTHSIFKKDSIDPTIDILGFFEALEKERIKLLGREKLKADKDWLQRILSKLTLTDNWFFDNLGTNAIPQIWIPGTGWFNPVLIDKNIQILYDVFIKKHATEGSAIEVKNKFTLLVQSEDVNSTVHVFPKKVDSAGVPAWHKKRWIFPVVSTYLGLKMYGIDKLKQELFFDKKEPLKLSYDFYYPEFISTNKETDYHFFNKIIVEPYEQDGQKYSGILQFVRDSFLNLRKQEIRKTFFIKELIGFNDTYIFLKEMNNWGLTNIDKTANDGFLKELAPFLNKDVVLSNVVISTWMKDKKINVDLFFQFAEKAWRCQMLDIDEKEDKFEDACWKFEETILGVYIDGTKADCLSNIFKDCLISVFGKEPEKLEGLLGADQSILHKLGIYLGGVCQANDISTRGEICVLTKIEEKNMISLEKVFREAVKKTKEKVKKIMNFFEPTQASSGDQGDFKALGQFVKDMPEKLLEKSEVTRVVFSSCAL